MNQAQLNKLKVVFKPTIAEIYKELEKLTCPFDYDLLCLKEMNCTRCPIFFDNKKIIDNIEDYWKHLSCSAKR